MTPPQNLARSAEWSSAIAARPCGARPEEPRASESAEELAAVAAREYAGRRKREQLIPVGIFSEPGWDMLLDLYVQRFNERPVSVQSLCIASNVPATTALRWIDKLRQLGFVERRGSPSDHRVVHISLTQTAIADIETYLRERCRQDAEAGARRSVEHLSDRPLI